MYVVIVLQHDECKNTGCGWDIPFINSQSLHGKGRGASIRTTMMKYMVNKSRKESTEWMRNRDYQSQSD